MKFNFIELFPALSQKLSYSFWGNTIYQYLIFFLAFTLSIFILIIFKQVVIRKLRKLAKRTKGDIDDLIVSMMGVIGWPFYVLIAFHASFYFIKIPLIIGRYLPTILFVLIIYFNYLLFFFFFFKQKTAYEIYQCDWSSDVCSSDLNSRR